MSDGFEGLIDDALGFFRELEANNRKDWFEPRKETYNTRIKKPAELLAALLAEDLGRISATPFKPKLFRIYRDVRFSKDKTPYNTHLHLSWFPPGGESRPGWFFGAAPSYLFLGTGVPALQGPKLAAFRAEIDADGDTLSDALEAAHAAVGAKLSEFGAAPLKRVPKPYDPDHPHGDLLKRKGLVIGADLPPDWRETGLVASLTALARQMEPVRAWIDRAMTERRA
ncbi:MAG: DUF2461 domain-containing protein [Pseudomonadota bacterium]